jgi:hypothetical protein
VVRPAEQPAAAVPASTAHRDRHLGLAESLRPGRRAGCAWRRWRDDATSFCQLSSCSGCLPVDQIVFFKKCFFNNE